MAIRLRKIAWGHYAYDANGVDWRVERRQGAKATEPDWFVFRDGQLVGKRGTLGAVREYINKAESE